MSKPKVSIIVPVYNVEPYLRRSMDCLLNQTMQELEFICIDDCSEDNSLSILREYEAKDARFKIITSDKNGGAAVARNKGLDIAQGEYLGFVDPDDAIDLNYYEELYKKAKEQDYDIVKCLRKNISTEGYGCIGGINDNIKMNGIYAFTHEWQTAIYKASIIYDNNIRFVPEIIKAQDIVFLNQIILKAKNISLIDNVYYYYYKRENSLNSSKISLDKIKSACLAIETILSDINNSNLYQMNIADYIMSYYGRLFSMLGTYYQNDTEEAHLLCINTLIKYYHKCKDIKLLDKQIQYQNLKNLIKSKNTNKIIKILAQYDSLSEYKFDNNYKFIERIFSIKNKLDENNKSQKIITILGVKIKLRMSTNAI